jgi:hypothetical protein
METPILVSRMVTFSNIPSRSAYVRYTAKPARAKPIPHASWRLRAQNRRVERHA